MNILTAVNDKYVYPFEVMLISLMENVVCDVNVYVFYNNLNKENRERILKISQRYKRCELEFTYIDEKMFSKMPLKAVTNPYITIETYFRLAMAEKLPLEIDKILYLDTDLIINHSLEEVYDTRFDKSTIAYVCSDHGIEMNKKIKEKLWSNFGFDKDYKYFNAGVLLISIENLRKRYSFQDFIEFIQKNYDKLIFHDQDVLNVMWGKYVKYLDYNLYNARPFYYPFTKKSQNILNDAVIVHYGEKPWDENFTDMGGNIFYKYAQMIDDGKRISRIKSMQKMYLKKHRLNIMMRYVKRNLKILLTNINLIKYKVI